MTIKLIWNVLSKSIKLSILVIVGLSMLFGCASDRSAKSASDDLQSRTTNNTNNYNAEVTPQKEDSKKTESQVSGTRDIGKSKIHSRIKRNISIVNVRPEPSMKKKQIAKLKGGDSVEVIDEKGTWTKVRFQEPNGNQVTGWINNSALESYRNNPGHKKPNKVETNKSSDVSEKQLSPM